jgi:SAM-dependent methyltransferase
MAVPCSRWMNAALASRCAALEADWLQGRLTRLGHAPNLALSAVTPAHAADIVLELRSSRELAGTVRCESRQWPFADGTFGTIAIQHAHEFHPDPMQLFSEAARVLTPGGRLLVCGFSPYAWSRWHRLRRGFQSRPRLHAPGRLLRQLATLGFKGERAQSLPWPESRVEKHLPVRAMHAIYLLIGLKQPAQWISSGALQMPAGAVPG